MRKKENKTPKEILRDEDVEKAIENMKVFTSELFRTLTKTGMPPETVTLYNPDIALGDINILLKYIDKLEESHAHVYNAYQDLGKENFKLEEKIDNKIKELEEKKINENDLREFVKIGNQIEVLKEIRGE